MIHGGACRLGWADALRQTFFAPYVIPGSVRVRSLDVRIDVPVPASEMIVFVDRSVRDGWLPPAHHWEGAESVTRYLDGRNRKLCIYDLVACAKSRREAFELAPNPPAYSRSRPHATRFELRIRLPALASVEEIVEHVSSALRAIFVVDIRRVNRDSPFVEILPQVATYGGSLHRPLSRRDRDLLQQVLRGADLSEAQTKRSNRKDALEYIFCECLQTGLSVDEAERVDRDLRAGLLSYLCANVAFGLD